MPRIMAGNQRTSLLDQLRRQYETTHVAKKSDEIENFEAIDARLREAFRWL